ncbi:MAG: hypothetical protein AAFX06_19975 [Planctomycetota bacterium]
MIREIPKDTRGASIQPGSLYRVSERRKPHLMMVFHDPETDCYGVQLCTETGKPVPGSHPQRLDEMAPGLTWEPYQPEFPELVA